LAIPNALSVLLQERTCRKTQKKNAMKKISFPNNPTLPLLQKYVQEKCIERGFTKASNLETYLLLTEEVGELAKAIRKKIALFTEKAKEHPSDQAKEQTIQDNLAEEMADVLSYLLDLANRFDVDLAESFKRKEAENDQRTWQ